MIAASINSISPPELYDRIKYNPAYANLKKFDGFKGQIVDTVRNGAYKEIIDLFEYLESKEYIFDFDELKFIQLSINAKTKCLFFLGKFDEIITLCKNAVEEYTEINILIAAYDGLGISYQNLRNYGQAYEYQMKEMALLEQVSAEEYATYKYNNYMNIGYLYHGIDEFKEACFYYEKARDIIEKYIKHDIGVSYYINAANAKLESGEIDEFAAIKMLDKVIDWYDNRKQKQNVYAQSFFHLRIAQLAKLDIYLDINDKASHLKLLKSLLPIENYQEPYIALMLSKHYLSYLFDQRKNDEYLLVLDKMMELQDMDKGEEIIIETLNKGILITKAKGDIALTNKYLEKLTEFQQMTLANNKKTILKIVKAKNDIKLKEKEIKYLKEIHTIKEEANAKLIEKNKELESFASIASHDIKAPLRNISSFLTILKERLNLDSENLELFNYVDTSAKNMYQLVEDLLIYARSGVYTDPPSLIDLNTVIERVKDNLYTAIEDSQTEIIINNDLPQINAHLSPLTQLFQNLIHNSIKFQKNNVKPVIEIDYQLTKGYHQVTVADNGIGIPEKFLKKVFQPLVKLNAKSKYEGSGLGLATCAKIVHHLDGEIQLESTLGQGSIFTISFPEH